MTIRWLKGYKMVRKHVASKITVMCIIGFTLAAILLVADETFDIPARLFNAPPTPVNWTEIGLEVFYVAIVATFVTLAISRLSSERKRAEESLRRVNRALKTLSECNQILVRSTDESTLLKGTCRILITHGGYCGTRVGLLDPGEGGTVRPAAEAWQGNGNCKNHKIAWPEDEDYRVIFMEVVNTGKPLVLKNIHNDASYAHLRVEADERGYTSLIALPLSINGQTSEVLIIYSAEASPFGEDEVELLTELANDLAYGIKAQRMRVERERAEDALRQSEERYRDLFDNAHDLIQSVSPEGGLLYVNKAWQNALGYSEKEVANLKLWDIIHPDSMNHCMEVFQRVISGESVSGIEAAFVAKDGSLLAVEGNAHCRFVDGRPVSTQGIFRDVTDRKMAEELVSHLNSVLRAIRGVNQLITLEKNRKRLIQQSCSLMVKTRGFLCAWILLFDEKRKYISAAVTGVKETRGFSQQLEQGNYPPCIDRILAHKDSFAVCGDIVKSGQRCLHRDYHGEGSGLISRLEYEGKVYGVISAYIQSDYASDPEGQSLFRELAGDIAFALHNIEEEEKHEQAEKALRESEEKYRNLVERASDGICIIQDKLVKYANLRQAEMWGGTVEELINTPFINYIHPDDLPRIIDRYNRRMAGEQVPSVYEAYLRRKDGGKAYAELNIGVINFLGKPAELVITRDLTERKQAEEAIRESEERYHALLELGEKTGEAVVMLQDDERGIARHVFASDAWSHMTGYPKEELLNMSFVNLIHPKDREAAMTRYRRRMAGEVLPGLYEKTLIRKDATEIPIEGTYAYSSYKGKRAIVGYIRDITKRKLAEEALKASEEKLRLMFESVPEGITVSDLGGDILETNEAAVRMHGYDCEEELIGKSSLELIAEKDHSKAIGNLKKTLERGQSPTVEYTFLSKDGSEFPAELSAALLKDGAGNPAGFIAVTRDITERKKMEEQLILTDRLASVGELASGIAHELNNPLTGVIGLSQLLAQRNLPEDIKEDLNLVYSEAQRAAHVVKNLLTFARKHPPAKELLNINDVISKVLELRAYEERVSNIEVVTHLAPDLPQIMADYFQLQQVFLNIVINAEHFMVEARNKGTLTITTEMAGDGVRASFTDDGPGIPKENLGHIFDPFFTTKEVGKGTGLGLSICHGIISAHNGRIYVESEPAKGATFIVELPLSQEETE
jgi:PAS domain S-box-containing protein